MNGGDAAAWILLLIIFLAGVMTGVFVIVSRASVREDKRHSVKWDPPDTACGGARHLVGFSHRDLDRQPPPDDTLPMERADQHSGRRWGDER
jgi:hypothetical protein